MALPIIDKRSETPPPKENVSSAAVGHLGLDRVKFFTHVQDNLGVTALEVLGQLGCETHILTDGERSPEDGVVLFSDLQAENNRKMTARLAGHRNIENRPLWAVNSPLSITLLQGGKNLDKAVTWSARRVEDWLAQGLQGFPTTFNQAKQHGEELEKWTNDVRRVFTGKPWDVTPGLHPEKRRKVKKQGNAWVVATQTKQAAREKILNFVESLSEEERLKEALLIHQLGAFNRDVCLSMPPEQLHSTYTRLVKRLALVVEASQPGAGSDFYKFVEEVNLEQLSERTSFMPKVEALLVYGRDYEKLRPLEQAVCDQYQLSDEQSHFSRIMDTNELLGIKRIVGVVDAGDPLVVRMMLNAARYRGDLGLKEYYPVPHKPNVETADLRDPLTPRQVRKTYPFVNAVFSADSKRLAQDMMEIYRRLITQYPLELTMLMLEEWLMRNQIQDHDASFTASQLIRKDGNKFELKLVNVGGGKVVVKGTETKVFDFPPDNTALGSLKGQAAHRVTTLQVNPGDQIFVFPKTAGLVDLKSISLSNTVGMQVNLKKHEQYKTFEWTRKHVQEGLTTLIEELTAMKPPLVDIQFGHVHGDRDPDEDQVVGSIIAGALAKALHQAGITTEQRPLSDNYHVLDRLDFPKWIQLLMENSGLPITEVQFEDALITRHFGDQLIARLFKLRPDLIFEQGGNFYLRPEGQQNMAIELYDGVTEENPKGRMGCIPFQLGLEVYRLNPALANTIYKDYITTNFPDSLVAQWWRDYPEATYQELLYRNVYLLPADQRMALKARVDEEIDRPFAEKCQSGDTSMLDTLIESADLNRVLMHVLEGFYEGQELKSTAMWQSLNLPPFKMRRIHFNRGTGKMEVKDWNRKQL